MLHLICLVEVGCALEGYTIHKVLDTNQKEVINAFAGRVHPVPLLILKSGGSQRFGYDMSKSRTGHPSSGHTFSQMRVDTTFICCGNFIVSISPKVALEIPFPLYTKYISKNLPHFQPCLVDSMLLLPHQRRLKSLVFFC